MATKKIKISESTLNKIIQEGVSKVLKEINNHELLDNVKDLINFEIFGEMQDAFRVKGNHLRWAAEEIRNAMEKEKDYSDDTLKKINELVELLESGADESDEMYNRIYRLSMAIYKSR